MSALLKISGENYFIDFANIEKLISSGFKGGEITDSETVETFENGKSISKITTNKTYQKGKEVDAFRYESIREMIDILLTTEEGEDSLGSLNKTSISFKLAFNTLIEYGVLNIVE